MAVFCAIGFVIIKIAAPVTGWQSSRILNRPFLGLFTSALVGVTASVTVYATVVTGFKTISLAYYLLAIFLVFELRRSNNITQAENS